MEKLMNGKSARIALSSIIVVSVPLVCFGIEANTQSDFATNTVGQLTNAIPAPTQEDRELLSLKQKADKGEPAAQFLLGKRYHEGLGVEQNHLEAVKWYRKAAERGDTNAQLLLAGCYALGEGVGKDPTEAVKWYRKAARQGERNAQFFLGCLYFIGSGVKTNQSEGVKWCRKAAEQGLSDAQASLGVCYANGNGVRKDLVEAHKWLDIAASQGEQSVGDWRERLALSMTPAQLAEAKRRSSKFVPKKEGTSNPRSNYGY